jgi:hypothetical protein
MIDKKSYNAAELAKATGWSMNTICRLLKEGKIRHEHIHSTHHNVRISRDEYLRIVEAATQSPATSV